ncbi:uncharacterized protein At1g01500 [Physcomitrium patens]|uniref:Erythronate-4-phosphate dehydrogenase family protein n=1 Tax=Physcomitrium patens TaxID=3218 RepID=A0A2K1L8D9_PHYPA|nr:uncharacterized protein At1g01500-like [Physcomitrium patens]PNR62300.1 hypothetical protein PHYPA_000724 [Physcomitrium patens]|eukprot:XP_024383431.1 uncharacterized protein At1g01500-like [Physcomitrella patens]
MDDFEEDRMGLGGEMSVAQKNGRAALFGYTVAASPGQAWFDVRVIYVRVTECPLDDAPESLTIRFPARSIGTALEVNGARISPSEEVCLVLKRDRVDTDSSEATYLSTDNLRTSGSLKFEVLHKEEVLLCGALEQSQPAADAEEYKGSEAISTPEKTTKLGWTMECACAVGQSGCVFLKGRHDYPSVALAHPVMEVCVVGRFAGTPVILTQTVQILARRRPNRQATLDAIPETEEVTCNQPRFMDVDQPVRGNQPDLFMDHADKAITSFGYALEGSPYGDQDNGQLTWFNAGVRVGVGIGLGMCLGVGIGVGLMIRTYQATTRTFRRGLL